MALSKIEKQLAGLAASLPRTDPVLQMLLRATDLHVASFGLTLTVLVDGYLIRGNLMGSREYAEQLEGRIDTVIAEAIEQYGAGDDRSEFAEAWRGAMSGRFSRNVAEMDEAEQKEQEAFQELAQEKGVSIDDLDLDDLPDDLAFAQIFRGAARSVLTLQNAALLVPPMFHSSELGVVRIHTSQIGAWWIPTREADASES